VSVCVPQAEHGGHVQTPTQHRLLQGVPRLQGAEPEPLAEQGDQKDRGLPDDHREPQAEQGWSCADTHSTSSTAGSPRSPRYPV
jgi:hypothetical protein